MEALYEACGSERKEIHIMEGKAHGTDMVTIPPEGELGYASFPETDREREDREELAGELMRFVREAFGEEPDIRLPEASQGNQDAQMPADGQAGAAASGNLRRGNPQHSPVILWVKTAAGMSACGAAAAAEVLEGQGEPAGATKRRQTASDGKREGGLYGHMDQRSLRCGQVHACRRAGRKNGERIDF